MQVRPSACPVACRRSYRDGGAERATCPYQTTGRAREALRGDGVRHGGGLPRAATEPARETATAVQAWAPGPAGDSG